MSFNSSVFEASTLAATKTLLLKHYLLFQGMYCVPRAFSGSEISPPL